MEIEIIIEIAKKQVAESYIPERSKNGKYD